MCRSPQASCSTPRQPVTNHEGQFVPGRGPYRLVKPTPAPGEKLAEKGAVGAEQYRCRAHCRARASGNCLDGSRVMIFSEPNQVAADIRKRRLRQYPARRGCEYTPRLQHLARQEQPALLRIVCEIAKVLVNCHARPSSAATRSPAGVSSPKMRTDSRQMATAAHSQ